jgi:hypothetical protein
MQVGHAIRGWQSEDIAPKPPRLKTWRLVRATTFAIELKRCCEAANMEPTKKAAQSGLRGLRAMKN